MWKSMYDGVVTAYKEMSTPFMRRYLFFYFLIGFLFVVMGLLLIGPSSAFNKEIQVALGIEFVGGAYFLVVAIGIDMNAEQRSVEQEKERLVLQMGSPDRGFAVEAARIMRAREWGFGNDTTLHDAHLAETDLQNVSLHDANLEGADLRGANLREATLMGANLQRANLAGAKLQGTHLLWADLQGAVLRVERLGLTLKAEFDEETLLPDGSRWAPDTDMKRFTDPTHPDFLTVKDMMPKLPESIEISDENGDD